MSVILCYHECMVFSVCMFSCIESCVLLIVQCVILYALCYLERLALHSVCVVLSNCDVDSAFVWCVSLCCLVLG